MMNADDVCSGFKEINADEALQQSDGHTNSLSSNAFRDRNKRRLDLIYRFSPAKNG
jgi:hypothetical protein